MVTNMQTGTPVIQTVVHDESIILGSAMSDETEKRLKDEKNQWFRWCLDSANPFEMHSPISEPITATAFSSPPSDMSLPAPPKDIDRASPDTVSSIHADEIPAPVPEPVSNFVGVVFAKPEGETGISNVLFSDAMAMVLTFDTENTYGVDSSIFTTLPALFISMKSPESADAIVKYLNEVPGNKCAARLFPSAATLPSPKDLQGFGKSMFDAIGTGAETFLALPATVLLDVLAGMWDKHMLTRFPLHKEPETKQRSVRREDASSNTSGRDDMDNERSNSNHYADDEGYATRQAQYQAQVEKQEREAQQKAPAPAPRRRGSNIEYRTEDHYSYKESHSKRAEAVNVELIDARKEARTVVVVKNVPYRVKPPEMVRVLGELNCGIFKYMYMPTDINTGNNLGYVFVKFNDSSDVAKLYRSFHGRVWHHCARSIKSIHITFARFQGFPKLREDQGRYLVGPDGNPINVAAMRAQEAQEAAAAAAGQTREEQPTRSRPRDYEKLLRVIDREDEYDRYDHGRQDQSRYPPREYQDSYGSYHSQPPPPPHHQQVPYAHEHRGGYHHRHEDPRDARDPRGYNAGYGAYQQPRNLSQPRSDWSRDGGRAMSQHGYSQQHGYGGYQGNAGSGAYSQQPRPPPPPQQQQQQQQYSQQY